LNILFLKITNDYDSLVGSIKKIGGLFGYHTEVYDFNGFSNLREHLCNQRPPNEKIDIIFVAAHSNIDLISNDTNGSETLTWKDFADLLCGCDGITDNTKIYLGCCDGGYKKISLTMMTRCPSINSVSGTPCVLNTHQSPLAFHTLLYGLDIKADDQQIARMVSSSIGISFNIHSRNELVGELAALSTVQALHFAGNSLENLDFDLIEFPFEL